MKTITKNIILFIIFAITYYCIEVLWRGHSYFAMAIVGGICGLVIGLSNEQIDWDEPLIPHGFHCAIYVTAIEFFSGLILNVFLGLNLWDYSDLPGNVFGIICPQFFFAWWALGIIGTIFDDWLRYVLFGEPMQKYRWI